MHTAEGLIIKSPDVTKCASLRPRIDARGDLPRGGT